MSSVFAIIIFFLFAFIQIATSNEHARASLQGLRPHWISDSHHSRNVNPTKWMDRKIVGNSNENRSPSSQTDTSETKPQYKGMYHYCHLPLG